MKPGVFAVAAGAAIATIPCFAQLPGAQTGPRISIPVTLELVDKPPFAPPVEADAVMIHEVHGGGQIAAVPDRDGNFTLANVRPGRYFLVLSFPFPGRIQVFARGETSLMPDNFELAARESGPLRIVVSLKTSALSVDVTGIPDDRKGIVALLSPADPYLTLQSSIRHLISRRHTEFPYTPPGIYVLFIVDSGFQMIISSSAAVRHALKDKATAVQVRDDGETKVTTTYLTPDAVRQAITAARETFEKQPGKANQK
jgi:hypothetical protein